MIIIVIIGGMFYLGTSIEALVTHSLVTGLYDTSSWVNKELSSSSSSKRNHHHHWRITRIIMSEHQHDHDNHDNYDHLHMPPTMCTAAHYVDETLVADYSHAEPGSTSALR